MFVFLRQMSVTKLSGVILRWIFHLGRYLGMFCFRLKSTTDGRMVTEESGPWSKWCLGIFRVGCLGLAVYNYCAWILTLKDLIWQFLHILQVLFKIAGSLCILRLHLVDGTDCTHLVQRFLQIFLKVQNVCKPKQKGFAKVHHLMFLVLTIVCLTYEGLFQTYIYIIKSNAKNVHIWIANIFVSIGGIFIMHIAVVGYLTLGLLYTNVNDYVSTQFRSQLESLEEQPTRQKLRKARKSLDKCLTLYEDVQSLTSSFHKIYNLPLLLSLGRKCVSLGLVSYSTIIQQDIGCTWHWSKVFIETLNMLLLTFSVHRTKLQFGAIRSLMLENCHFSENKEWQKTLEVFFTHLNLHEFRVRPLGLFTISNELMLIFLSALATYMTVILQYRMQMEVLTSLPERHY